MSGSKTLQRHLSPLGAWAFAIGTAVGWGSLVVTANTYLAQAGPLGSVLGLVIGAAIMLIMAWNYGYMMQRYPESGGAYAYTREVFGYDQAFLTAWFLAMTYFAILWANATSLPLFGRIFLGGVFRFGKLYTIFGYDVYIGEVLLTMAALALACFLCIHLKKLVASIMIVSNDTMLTNIQNYYESIDSLGGARLADENFVESEIARTQAEDTRTMLMMVGMFTFALFIMLNNHSYMTKRSQESERLANIDPMTGVKSKHAYLVQENALNHAIEQERAHDFAIAVCDVNGLKKINDTLGHKAGDEYIRQACCMVCDVFQHSPVYRVGGDEFVVFLSGRDYPIRRELMQVLHDRSVEHISSGGAVVSAGLADYEPEQDTGTHDVFERADALMYKEKQLLKSLGAVTRDEESKE